MGTTMKKVSNEGKSHQLEGMFIPFNPDAKQPVLLKMDGKFFLPVFSTREKLEKASEWVDIGFASHNVIVSYEEFKKTVFKMKQEVTLHVIVDPYVTEEKNIRFHLIVLDEEEKSYLGEDHGS
jgi:hypothetical protein